MWGGFDLRSLLAGDGKISLIWSGGVKRSGGVENLAETGSSSGTDEGASTLGRGRSRSRSLEVSPFS